MAYSVNFNLGGFLQYAHNRLRILKNSIKRSAGVIQEVAQTRVTAKHDQQTREMKEHILQLQGELKSVIRDLKDQKLTYDEETAQRRA